MTSVPPRTSWSWETSYGRIPPAPDPRRRAVVQATVMVVIGAALWLLAGSRLPALIVGGLAAAVLALGLVAPRLYAPLDRLGERAGHLAGRALAFLLLVPLYLLVFVPGRLLVRITGRDPLLRRPRAPEQTCWIPRRRAPDPASYERQFLVEDPGARRLRRPVGAGSPAPGRGEAS